MFTRNSVVNETHICKSTIAGKYIVGLDASQPYARLMGQPIPTVLHITVECNADSKKTSLMGTNLKVPKKKVMLYF